MVSTSPRVFPKLPTTSVRAELRIAIDTGGTFTDCVWIEQGKIKTLKVFSTPDDPSRAIAEALKQIIDGVRASSSAGEPRVVLLHGTTVGTNALLQRKGARVALVTTAGFEDVIEIGRQARPRLYDFFFDRVEPLVSKEMRFGVSERVDRDGQILLSPTHADLVRLKKVVASSGAQSLAVCLLFSFANPQNELSVAKVLHGMGKPLSISHRILPGFREYERTVTVVVNAYLQPLMQQYMQRLSKRGEVFGTHAKGNRDRAKPRIFVMQSNGGIAALQSAAREPVRTILSGPAGDS